MPLIIIFQSQQNAVCLSHGPSRMPVAATCLLYFNRATGLVPKGLRTQVQRIWCTQGTPGPRISQHYGGRHLVDVMADIAANIDQHIDQSSVGQHASQISDNMSLDISWTTSGADQGLNTDCFPKQTPEGFSFQEGVGGMVPLEIFWILTP